MRYNVDFELCSLLFLLLLTARYFSMRRFPNKQNRLFGWALLCAIADILLDVVSAYTIMYAAVVPVWLNYLTNTLFYSLQVAFPGVMCLYVAVLADLNGPRYRLLYLLYLPAVFYMGTLLVNPFTGWIFSLQLVNGVYAYVYGDLFFTLYYGTAIYVVAGLVMALIWRKRLERRQFATFLVFVSVVVAAVVIQYFHRDYLLTGVALALSIMMMYFTMQNPQDMLDLISGTFNYAAMMSFLSTRIREKRQLWLVAADIGGIRRVNSTIGLSAGNDVFAQIGAFVNGMGPGVWAFRMIGARFLLVADSDAAYRRAIEQLEDRFDLPWAVKNDSVNLSVTIRYFGEWDFFKSAEDVVNLIDLAFSDVAPGDWGHKKRISSQLMLLADRRMKVENAIRAALDTERGFSLVFQPLLDVKTGRYPSAEVLLRLTDPELGSISPAEFIPVAEKTGLITRLDELVVRSACRFYLRNERDLRGLLTCLEINLSAAEFMKNPGERIHPLVRSCDMSPDLLCFEIIETAAVAHTELVGDFMRSMIRLGYSFALDDFGTGYANITRVTELPFRVIKLDRALLIREDERSCRLLAGLLSIFSDVGLETVVEGVETAHQADRVVSQGVDHIQGFFYAYPMCEEDYITFMRKQSI